MPRNHLIKGWGCLRALSLLLCLLLVLCLPALPATAARQDEGAGAWLSAAEDILRWQKGIQGIPEGEGLLSGGFLAGAGSAAVDWYPIAMGRLGYPDDYGAYLAVAEQYVAEKYATEQKLDATKATEWHRVALAILSSGGDPTALDGGAINLVADGTWARGKTRPLDAQGVNGLYWALLLMDGLRYEVPADARDTRDGIIAAILESQQPDGGFGLAGDGSAPDMTGMALQALAPYYNSEQDYDGKTVRAAVDEALAFLSGAQLESGGFPGGGSDESCESAAQVIIALCSLGIDPAADARFVKGGSAVDALLAFRQADGGFAHSPADGGSNPMASEQALLALAALARHHEGLRTVFDFRPEMEEDVKTRVTQATNAIAALGDAPGALAVEAAWADYLTVPPEERSYVRGYGALADALAAQGIPNDSGSLVPAMDQNTGGNGYIYDLFAGAAAGGGAAFTDLDAQTAAALPVPLTTEQAATVTSLLGKLRQAENRADYAQTEENLVAAQAEVEAIEAEIEAINAEVLEHLYPFEDLDRADAARVSELAARLEALSEYDRARVLGAEDLLRARAQLNTESRGWVIALVAAGAIAALVVVVALRVRGRKKQRARAFADLAASRGGDDEDDEDE